MTKNFGIETSKIHGNKRTISSLSLILMLAMTLMMAFVQPTLGQYGVPQPEKTVGYVTVAPTLIGVGQDLTCNLWVMPVPTKYNYASEWDGFYGVEVTFVRPDGTRDTFMPTDGTGAYAPGQMQGLGALFFFYKPQMAGNWSISWTMPAQNVTSSPGTIPEGQGTVQYLGCTSNTFYFTVQTDTVLAGLLNGYPWSPLPNPNVFWDYPINANNREWNQISGDWTGTTSTMAAVNSPTHLKWQPYGPGPNTAHIVWTNPLMDGGIIGGSYGSINYWTGQTRRYVVMNGMVFSNIPNTSPTQFRCIDQSTGQVLYQKNGSITYGIHLPSLLGAYQQSGTAVAVGEVPTLLESSYGSNRYPFLYGTSTVSGVSYWSYYDTLTGDIKYEYANATGSRLIDGTVLAFGVGTIVGQTGRYVFRWNQTSVTGNNWPTGITWKVTQPLTSWGANPTLFAVSSDISVVVIGTKNQYWGFNADTGAQLWNITLPYPITSNEQIPLAMVDDFIVFDATAATFHAYSIKTGAELWETPSFASSPWATTWSVYDTNTNDLNNMYMAFPDGAVRAYSLTDGHLLWTSTPFASTEYTNNAIPYVHTGTVMVGGLIYAYAGYSSSYELNPVPRFAMAVCINATTGDIVFTLNGGAVPVAAANGYVICYSQYDGQTYSIGKGPTSTSVTIQNDVVANGATVLIKGNVMDMSPASQNYAVQVRFPNGVPAVADSAMSEWMDYLHMQNATLLNDPPTPNGVTVSVAALDSNGGFIDLGTTTSDYAGQFAISWKPTSEGIYKIFATFSGSDSYYSSYAETALTVTEAPAVTPTDGGTEVQPDNTMLLYGILVAVVIAIVLALIAIVRKK